MNRRTSLLASIGLLLTPWKKLSAQETYQPSPGLQIRYVNVGQGIIDAFWDPSTFPAEAQQLQFRSVANVSAINQGLGYDVISTAEAIKIGRARLDNPQVIQSGVLLQVVAVPITAGNGTEYNYQDIEAGTIKAIVPL